MTQKPAATSATATRSDQLCRAIDASGTPGCVGLDPVLERIPEPVRDAASTDADAIGRFCADVLESIVGVVGVVKPQSACFERYGSAGYAALEQTVAHAKKLGFVVILDAKRGDIGSSAEHYAAGAVSMGADWITVSPYMGPSTIEPFLDAGLGVFALCRTSNPDSDRLQSLESGGSTLAQHTASMIAEMGASRVGAHGLSDLGAVVGATKSAEDGVALRGRMPGQFMLVPGVGAQGGTAEEVRPLARTVASSVSTLGVVVNASRSVLYPITTTGRSWQGDVRGAAEAFKQSLGVLTAT